MPIIKIPGDECGVSGDTPLIAGSRLEYRRALWKVVGTYDGHRSTHLIVRSLGFTSESLRHPYAPHAAASPAGVR